MKIRSLILAMIAFSAVTVHAEPNGGRGVFSNPDNKTRLALRISYQHTDAVDQQINGLSDALGSGSGFAFGPSVDIPLWRNLSLDVGLGFFFNNYSISEKATSDSWMTAAKGYDRLSIFGARLGVLAGYRFDFSDAFAIAIKTGPQLSLGFSTSAHSSKQKNSPNLYALQGGYLNRAGVLWAAGVEATLWRHFLVGATMSWGLTNMSADKPNRFKERILDVSVGYKF